MEGSACYYESMTPEKTWHNGFAPVNKLAQVGEITLRLTRIALYRKLQQAESHLKAMGVPNNLSEAFKTSSDKMFEHAFVKPRLVRTRVDTTSNSTF